MSLQQAIRFAGYAGLFGIPDADRDVIRKGAFAQTLANRTASIPLLWQHRTDQKIGDLITTAMDPEGAKAWFGAPPPDLTQVAKTRGGEWIYNYLKTFYDDPSRPFGVNNKVFPNVGMPNALAGLQGLQREACIQVPKVAENGGEMRDPLIPGLAITEEKCGQLVVDEGTGMYSAEEFDTAVYDLTNFLYYVAEPTRLERHRTGVFVLLFLIILGCFTYLLNREYWKDVR